MREVNEILRVEGIELRKHGLFVEFDINVRQPTISPFNIHVIIVIITTALILIQALQYLSFLLSTLVILYLFLFLFIHSLLNIHTLSILIITLIYILLIVFIFIKIPS